MTPQERAGLAALAAMTGAGRADRALTAAGHPKAAVIEDGIYDVEVTYTVEYSATVRVRADDALHAARIVRRNIEDDHENAADCPDEIDVRVTSCCVDGAE